MASYSIEAAETSANPSFFSSQKRDGKKKKGNQLRRASSSAAAEESWRRRSGSGVALEGYFNSAGSDGDLGSDAGGESVGRTKSLTDEDLDELKGCLDLGFGFSYDEIPELCETFPALELCYSMSQRFHLDDHHNNSRSPDEEEPSVALPSSTPLANWRISGPGDDPVDVKARLKYWAQAVACTVKLCNSQTDSGPNTGQ